MNINLNDSKFQDKLDVTYENIISFLSEYNIFRNYIGEFPIGRAFKSPIKEKDDNYSFSIYWSNKSPGKLLFADLALGVSGNPFHLLMRIYGVSYYDALLKVIYDFRLVDKFKVPTGRLITAQKSQPTIIPKQKIPKQSDNVIEIRIRNWQPHDLEYWMRYGITLEILRRYNIFAIDFIFLNNSIINADKYAYAYYEYKDGEHRYKIYQPFNTKDLKWLSNFIEGTLSGWQQMPEFGDNLIITSSSKDMMCIVGLGFNSIAPQTETYSFKPHIVDYLYSKFPYIYIFYDYDKAGITNAYKNKKTFGFIPIFTKKINQKDPSDFYYEYGKKRSRSQIKWPEKS